MLPGAVALLLSLGFTAFLRLRGTAPYEREFPTRTRRTIAFVLWVVVLAFAVFLPVSSTAPQSPLSLEVEAFPLLFSGHAVLSLFLLCWWRLSSPIGLSRFLHLEWTPGLLSGRLMLGLLGGVAGWGITILATSVVASAWFSATQSAPRMDVPEVILWMAELPATQKAAIVVVAMTVEEAFFRAFLQPRLGLLLSSMCFAASHFSYGLPFLVVGVFVVSLFLGWLFQRSQHLLPSIVAHGLFDAVQLFIVLPWAAAQRVPLL